MSSASIFDSDARLDESYESGANYNIFDHYIRFAIAQPQKTAPRKPSSGATEAEEESYFSNILKNAKLIVNRVHIRYEDDYFCQMNPFSFGLLCDQIASCGTNTEWHFGSLENNKFKRVSPPDSENLIIRETNLSNVRVYWKSMAEMFVPLSLYEATKTLDKQIFEAISLEDMRSMMRQSFADENLVESFSLFSNFTFNSREKAAVEAARGGRSKVQADFLFTKFKINLSPSIVNDIGYFSEYVSNLGIMGELKSYRPVIRPITSDPLKDSKKAKRKRLLIVRDWFFYSVWATRIKTALREVYRVTEKNENKKEELGKLYSRLKSMYHNQGGAIKNGIVPSTHSPRKLQEVRKFIIFYRIIIVMLLLIIFFCYIKIKYSYYITIIYLFIFFYILLLHFIIIV